MKTFFAIVGFLFVSYLVIKVLWVHRFWRRKNFSIVFKKGKHTCRCGAQGRFYSEIVRIAEEEKSSEGYDSYVIYRES